MLSLNQFFIKEHVGLLKFKDAYDIIDPAEGKVVGLAKEDFGVLVGVGRLLLNKQMLPTRIEILAGTDDNARSTVGSIVRGFSLLRPKIRVLAADGRQIGHFTSKLFSIGGGFHVFDHKGDKVGEVKGDWKGWNFKLVDTSGAEMGTVTKKWAGLGKELLTSADNYMIAIDGRLGAVADMKLLLLAACLAIDTVYKEK